MCVARVCYTILFPLSNTTVSYLEVFHMKLLMEGVSLSQQGFLSTSSEIPSCTSRYSVLNLTIKSDRSVKYWCIVLLF